MPYDNLEDFKKSITLRDRVKYSLFFWSWTALFSIYFIPAVILANIDPFFRRSLFKIIDRHLTVFLSYRRKKLQEIADKYTLLDRIKNS